MLTEGDLVGSVREYIDARQGMEWLVDDADEVMRLARERFASQRTEPLWFSLSEEGKGLVAGAIAIVNRVGIPEEHLVDDLGLLVQGWSHGR